MAYTPSPETRTGHRKALRAVGMTLVMFGVTTLVVTALLMWWR